MGHMNNGVAAIIAQHFLNQGNVNKQLALDKEIADGNNATSVTLTDKQIADAKAAREFADASGKTKSPLSSLPDVQLTPAAQQEFANAWVRQQQLGDIQQSPIGVKATQDEFLADSQTSAANNMAKAVTTGPGDITTGLMPNGRFTQMGNIPLGQSIKVDPSYGADGTMIPGSETSTSTMGGAKFVPPLSPQEISARNDVSVMPSMNNGRSSPYDFMNSGGNVSALIPQTPAAQSVASGVNPMPLPTGPGYILGKTISDSAKTGVKMAPLYWQYLLAKKGLGQLPGLVNGLKGQ